MADPQKPRQASVHYEERAGKPAIPVAGAYGGTVAPGHYVTMHVYSEWGMIPSIEQHEEGAPKPKYIKRGDIHREVQASLVMSPEVAITVGRWLLGKGVQALQVRQEHGSPDIDVEVVDDDEDRGEKQS